MKTDTARTGLGNMEIQWMVTVTARTVTCFLVRSGDDDTYLVSAITIFVYLACI